MSEIILEDAEESNDEEPIDPSIVTTKTLDIVPEDTQSTEGYDRHGKEKSLDLDELFEFEEARKKVEQSKEQVLAATIAEEGEFIPHRIFISHVDGYLGKYFAQVLSDLPYATGEEAGEEAGEEEQEPEEQEDEEQEDAPEAKPESALGKVRYEIVGTAGNPTYRATEDVARVISYEQSEDYVRDVMKCGYVIFDISAADGEHIAQALWTLKAMAGELEQRKTAAPKAYRRSTQAHRFILISPVMTWALTKPPDPDDPELAHTETDFRRRKPHPNYRAHCAAEKEVIKAGKQLKPCLATCVLCTGVAYGGAQDTLQLLFKHAWLLHDLPLFAPGSNSVPLVSLQDLAKLMGSLVARFPASAKYLLAVEPSVTSLKSLVTAVSRTLGTGHVTLMPREQAFLDPELTQEVYEKLTVRLRMEPDMMAERVDFDTSFAEDVRRQAAAYTQARGIRAMKIVLLGPPCSGKTRLARRLCQRYGLHYLSVDEVIQQALEDLRAQIARLEQKEREKEGEKEEVEEEEEETAEDEEQLDEENLEDLRERLLEMEANMAENAGRLDQRLVDKLVALRLASNACRNQGYVLDDYPAARAQAAQLFRGVRDELRGEQDEQLGEDDEEPPAGATPMPDHVISLVASDAMLAARVVAMREPSMRSFAERLGNYRRENGDDGNTVLDFFDEAEVHPLLVRVDEDDEEAAYNAVVAVLGKPVSFGLLAAELEAARAAEELAAAQAQEQARRAEEERVRSEELRLHAQREQWVRRWSELKELEETRLVQEALPLRHYLVRYVLPTLVKGLVEVAKIKPEDPVDYLAEFLFRQNPEGRMFEPDFCNPHSELLMAIELQEAAIFSFAPPDIPNITKTPSNF